MISESGALKNKEDVEKVVKILCNLKTSAETLPYLDTLLLACKQEQAGDWMNAHGDDLAQLLANFSVDRLCAIRVLTFGKIAEFKDPRKFLRETRRLVEETIDSSIKQTCIETAAHIDAISVLIGEDETATGLEVVPERLAQNLKRRQENEEEEAAKKMRSIKEYKEQKKMKKSSPSFEKLLKDTVASICYDKLVGHELNFDGGEVPEWRKIYRHISTVLMEKESRLPEEIRFKCSTDEDKDKVVKRVSQFTLDFLRKQQF